MLSRCNILSFIILILVLGSKTPLSYGNQPTQDLQDLSKKAEDFIRNQLLNDPRLTEVNVKAVALDKRLKMPLCETPIVLEANNISADSTRATVKASCKQPIPWGFYISATVDGKVLAAVASRSLGRGQRVSNNDVVLEERSLADLPRGYLSAIENVVGMQTRRTFTQGEAYKVTALTPAVVIKKGDSVVVEAATNLIAVATPGTALTDGKVGQQIPIKNSRSKRTIKAVVMGPGRVEIRL